MLVPKTTLVIFTYPFSLWFDVDWECPVVCGVIEVTNILLRWGVVVVTLRELTL
jgi:hypothetical protein